MKKALKGFITGAALICLTGCGNEIPEMTQQEQELVVEYAASELLKFDRNYAVKLVTLEEQEEEAPEEELGKAPGDNQGPDEEEADQPGGITEDEVTVIDQAETEEEVSIEQFLGLSDVEISYTGFETADSYPPAAADEVFFCMDATENSQLLVLKFDVKNTSSDEREIDLAACQARYKIVVDGSAQNALTTMLLNDMAYYQGSLAAGETTELVVVGEVPAEQAGQAATLELIMKRADDTATISLN